MIMEMQFPPATCRALVLSAIKETLLLETRPTPQATSGSAVTKILAAAVLYYSRDIYNGTHKYELATPSVPGSGAIGRVAAIGPDATRLQVGDLVFIDIYIRGRDDYSVGALSENCFSLNEKRLLGSTADGGLGYTIDDLLYVAVQLVPFGGLRSIGLAVCDKIIISPAIGAFGSAAVQVALAMGASVIAMCRNKEALKNLKLSLSPDGSDDHIQLIQITNDLQQEVEAPAKLGPADAFFDTSPKFAAGSSHIKSAIMSLRHRGRICLMGGAIGDMEIPASPVVRRNLTIKGKWMYERDDIIKLIQMVGSGVTEIRKGSWLSDSWQIFYGKMEGSIRCCGRTCWSRRKSFNYP
ncbi:alcohol dehydrogenase [Penicillium waksmanii]|uniref:alcohol dehydrogenase n=1 Tax=Penicillium waksmanii TaxID=69791 RepID=UPI0025468862|nr:alcohol dehydrogenase [Penicillium waksmanii]KAJ6000854.1 alcohol dehydrogenase [Penicillium waksmanii]